MTAKDPAKQLFGTNGIRGVTGRDMVPVLGFSIGAAFGSMCQGCIAVGMDTRTSGESILNALKAGLMATGCDIVDCGILPTPALQYIVRDEFEGGAMITASHNPPEYNGIKIIDADGTEMADEKILKLEQRYFSRNFDFKSWDKVGLEIRAPRPTDKYIEGIVRQFPSGIGNGMLVIVDAGSGPACATTPEILRRLGCKVLTVNSNPDGHFPGRMPEPTPAGLAALSELVINNNASFGVAHDGDADRAVFIDEDGDYIEENKVFALFVQHICEQQKGIIVTPVSTSQLIEAVASKEGSSVIYTKVGSIYVARTMQSLNKRGKRVIFGGEGNGGLIFPAHQFCRDGGMTAAAMVDMLASRHEKLSDLVTRLPKRYMIKEKISCTTAPKIIKELQRAFFHESIDHTDGLKISRGNTWALIRASGTEPLLRIIIESDTRKIADLFYHELMGVVLQHLPDK